ncbi:MAG TPA: hypothetical protein VD930_00535 [Gemmatimonadales bacterium]|nr:hypothetical protein [Gemmatimonadales bacterium]
MISNRDAMNRPFFLITIDTEGDNLWAAPREITTRNAAFLPRFQQLCEKYGLKPTYLTNYEMVCAPAYQAFARDVLERDTAEIGMHLHAWNSPPLEQLTDDDFRYQPYLIEYPEHLIRAKVELLTRLLVDTFGCKMISHRAGRWSFNEVYARVLVEQGYRVDCSVTPHVTWHRMKGDPNQKGGTDFSRYPEVPYRVDLRDISQPGDSPLLEVPMTIMQSRSAALRKIGDSMPYGSLPARAWNRLFPPRLWLQPNGRNRSQMLEILDRALEERRQYVEFTLHSSEFMPGGSPTFQTEESIEKLYGDMEQLFSRAAQSFRGGTLSEFEQSFVEVSR